MGCAAAATAAVSEPASGAVDAHTAGDLDLFGAAGLEQLLGTPSTPAGWAALRRWIVEPAVPADVRLRQGVASELAPMLDFRQELAVRGRSAGGAQVDYQRFMEWAEGPGWLRRRRGLTWTTRVLSVLLVVLAIGQAAGLPMLPALVAVLAANAFLTLLYGPAVAGEIAQVAERRGAFRSYAEMFDLITHTPFSSPGMQALQTRLGVGTVDAGAQLRRLDHLMPLAEIRRVMFFFVFDAATLWSFHVLSLFEEWQRAAGGNVRAWLDALGEAEALAALAALHHGHPGWAFPEPGGDEASVLEAEDLAHPLLPPSKAVGNDVRVGPPGTFLLVTGSNMAGKSTLLRAIGCNAVLAQMGAPVVCRARCACPGSW